MSGRKGSEAMRRKTSFRNIRSKVPLGPFLLKALPLLILLLSVEHYVGQRFLIGGDDQVDRCLPDKRIYLIDTYNKDIWRGDLIAFRAERMKPYFKDGQVIVKIAAGVTGDRVQIDSRQTRINGTVIIEGLPLAEKLRKPPSTFKRDETIPAGAYWVTGLTPKSFDSRYWGYVYDHQVIGRAYAIF
jgi:conjugal transfer pilin signal peptidase TrbI